MKSVIICEKKDQAEKVREALGDRYGLVIALQGHVLQLKEPEEVREEWKVWGDEVLWPGRMYPTRVGRDPKNPKLEDNYRAILSRVKAALTGADQVIIATDCDREGQLIGDEVLEFLGWKGKTYRALFNALDKKSLNKSFENLIPNEQQVHVLDAAKARQQADQVANFSATRSATKNLRKMGSKSVIGIGRVKSPTMAVVCEREELITNFKPQAYYHVVTELQAESDKVNFRCSGYPKDARKINDEAEEVEEDDEDDPAAKEEAFAEIEALDGKITDKAVAEGLAKSLEGTSPKIVINAAKKTKAPPALFDLTSLSAEAGRKYNWSPDKVLEVAQSLYSTYEITTYPRSDVKYLPESEAEDIPSLVPALLGIERYSRFGELLEKPVIRKGKSGHFNNADTKDESHYAIVPNRNVADKMAEVYASLPQDELKLFDLIARRYLAALAPDYIYKKTDAHFIHNWAPPGEDVVKWFFATGGSMPISQGWRHILGQAKEADEIPEMQNGANLPVLGSKIDTKSTKAPGRFSGASLQVMMKQIWRLVPKEDAVMRKRLKEAKGIGTPATRPGIIKTLIEQGFFIVDSKGKIKPSQDAMGLWRLLREACPMLINPVRTALWESQFDRVMRGEVTALQVIEQVVVETRKEIARIIEAGARLRANGGGFGKAGKPSEKALGYAQRLSEHVGKPLPPTAKNDASVVMAFIEAHAPRDAEGKITALPPSQKMVDYAKDLASRLGVTLSEEMLANTVTLRAWVDENRQKAPPSEKALAYAKRLARAAGEELTPEILASMDLCMAYIKKLQERGIIPAPEGPPSDKQKALAKMISEQGGMAFPEGLEESAEICSKFIEAHKAVLDGRPPSEKQIIYARTLAAEAGVDVPGEIETSSRACSAFIEKLKQGGEGKASGAKAGTKAGAGKKATGKAGSTKAAAGKAGGGKSGPTEGQVKFAKDLAKAAGIAVPKEALASFEGCRAFIEKMKNSKEKAN